MEVQKKQMEVQMTEKLIQKAVLQKATFKKATLQKAKLKKLAQACSNLVVGFCCVTKSKAQSNQGQVDSALYCTWSPWPNCAVELFAQEVHA